MTNQTGNNNLNACDWSELLSNVGFVMQNYSCDHLFSFSVGYSCFWKCIKNDSKRFAISILSETEYK